jgi:flagellar protein FlaJ
MKKEKELFKVGNFSVRPFHLFIIGIGLVILIIDTLFFRSTAWFFPIVVLAISVAWVQFWILLIVKDKKRKELEDKFVEFVRNVVNSVKAGMPVPLAIRHVAYKDYGSLNPYAQKLANQLEWSIPLHKALWNFALSTKNSIIRRSVATVIEAEKSGGNIGDVLDSVARSVLEIRKLRDERRAVIYGQVVQSYIIFFVFLGVMIIIKDSLVPYLAMMQTGSLQELSKSGISLIRGDVGELVKIVAIDYSSVGGFFSSLGRWFASMQGVFLMLAIIQGFFAGLSIGKLAEDRVSAGLKHSLILMTIAAFVMSISVGV